MQTTLALVTLASVASAAVASAPGTGCSTSYDGEFQIEILSASAAKVKRQSSTCGQSGLLTATLSNGVLKDVDGRQGEVVANYQFQFDDILQPGAIYTEGFNVCSNGSLAIGGNAVFYACMTSGGPGIGNYSNLYSQSIGGQCDPVLIDVIPCGSSSAPAGQSGDGQVTVTGIVSQISDGQPQATATATGCVVSQINDGQLQMVTSCPTPTPTACVVSQIVDGQVQVTACPTTTAAPVSQISDGQIQATTTGAPVSQISDGQIQATTKAPAPVSQISDGQVQATTTGAPVSQISDGQIQATTVATVASSSKSNATAPSASSPVPVTNSGNGKSIASTFAAVLVGAAAVLLL